MGTRLRALPVFVLALALLRAPPPLPPAPLLLLPPLRQVPRSAHLVALLDGVEPRAERRVVDRERDRRRRLEVQRLDVGKGRRGLRDARRDVGEDGAEVGEELGGGELRRRAELD